MGTPPGEAPLEVRAAWVGLVLPLVPGDRGPHRVWTQGVVTGPRTFLGYLWARLLRRLKIVNGFRVDAAGAIQVLAQHNVVAAAWWRTHAPLAIQPGRILIFHAEACRLVDSPSFPTVAAPPDEANPGGPFTSDLS